MNHLIFEKFVIILQQIDEIWWNHWKAHLAWLVNQQLHAQMFFLTKWYPVCLFVFLIPHDFCSCIEETRFWYFHIFSVYGWMHLKKCSTSPLQNGILGHKANVWSNGPMHSSWYGTWLLPFCSGNDSRQVVKGGPPSHGEFLWCSMRWLGTLWHLRNL